MNIKDFLVSIDMHSEKTKMEQLVKRFMDEMAAGLNAEPSSLLMIPSYIAPPKEFPKSGTAIAIDAGGTNLRTALVSFVNGRCEISHYTSHPMPGSRGNVSSQEFFAEIAELILPLTDFSRNIGFSFSYVAEIFPNLDGKIISFNKEVSVKGAEGKIIGQELVAALKAQGAEGDFNFALMNDTLASLLGGIEKMNLGQMDGLAGMVLGTGNNMCYMERGERIKKLTEASDMIINCESGIFSGAFRGRSDEFVDSSSEAPGDHLLEKMLSGAYHGKVISRTIKLASKAGLLSGAFGQIPEPFSLSQIDEFYIGNRNNISDMCIGSDEERIREIIDDSFERAAKLLCANVAAVCLHVDGGKSEERPFYLVLEGSGFEKSLILPDKLERYFEEFIKGYLNRHIKCVRTDDATIKGAALAAVL